MEAAGYRGLDNGRKRFGPLHRIIADRLMAHGRTSTLVPRNHAKSTIISVGYPAWLVLRDPSRRVLLGSASLALAKELIGEIRELYRADLEFLIDGEPVAFPLLDAFPHVEPLGRRSATGPTDHLDIVGKTGRGRECTFFAGSPETSLTGRHPNAAFIDDPSDFKNTRTFEQRTKTNNWNASIEPILQSRDDPWHHIGTQWAPGDSAEWYQNHPKFDQLRLPAWVPENPQTGLADGQGPGPLPDGRWAEQFKGCYPIAPSFMTAAELHEWESECESQGQAVFFAAQALNIPMLSADAFFRDRLIADATPPVPIPAFEGYPEILLWDPTARVTGTKGDANGLIIAQPVPAKVYADAMGATLGLEPDRNVFIIRWAKQVNGGADDALQIVEALCADRPSIKAVWIEDVAAQKYLKPWLRDRGNIKGVRVRMQSIGQASQPLRIQGLATAMRDGQIVLPDDFEGRGLLVRQLNEYPNSDFDDLPCALALLSQHRERRGSLPDLPTPTLTEGDPQSLWPSQLGGRPSAWNRKSWP